MSAKKPGRETPYLDPRNLYVTTELSLDELAALLVGRKGCAIWRLKERSVRENWPKLREDWRKRVAEKYLADSEEEVSQIARRQLRDARNTQSVGKGILVAASHAIDRLGGVVNLLGATPTPKDVLYAIKIGSEVLKLGLEAERTLLGGTVVPELPTIRYETEYLPALTEGGGGNGPRGTVREGPEANDLDPGEGNGGEPRRADPPVDGTRGNGDERAGGSPR